MCVGFDGRNLVSDFCKLGEVSTLQANCSTAIMLGKRPPQIQRSTSMSQLRAPPGSRTRPPSTSGPARKDLVSQGDSSASGPMKAAAANTLLPNATEEMDVKRESWHNGNSVSVGVPPSMHGHLRAPHLSVKAGSASPSPSHAKHNSVESFMDACFFCKRPLGHGRDIFMYRGDAAFCTEECRFRQISCDEKCSVSASQTTTSDNTVGNAKSSPLSSPTGAF